MRELKFRVWSVDSYIELNNLRGEISIYFSPYDLGAILPEARGNVVIEQYTGIKDRNGKEIYEGDIIQTDRGARVIGWNNEYTRFGIHETREGFYCFCKLSNFEVIGNIHETPELLGGTNATNKEEE